jgi:SSS family solute:Na+ symporter
MMTPLDWTVVVLYLTAMIALSVRIARGQRDRRDYYLGGHRSGPAAIALSTMATQCSTNSILGAPAFVAFTVGGGMLWLQYELAVPLAMIVIMALLLPTLRTLQLVSVYEYLERRFGLATRLTLSLTFQLVRAFATGVTVYGIGLVLAVCLETDFVTAVVLLGVVTIVYDAIGGMRAVIVSDVIQLAVLAGAILLAIVVAVDVLGGVEATLAAVPEARLAAIDLAHTGWGDGHDYAFWPMLIGGLFLYVSYYGVDQSQTQRLLAARDVADGNRALLYNGLLRFPLVLSYCVLGLCIAAYAAVDPDFLDRLPLRDDGAPNVNLAVPQFVFEQFPPGLVGLVMVGLFAAAMSSLDSVLNALSATTMEDLVRRFRRTPLSARAEFLTAKALTVLWGVATVSFAFVVDEVADSVLVAINKIGSLINGPLLAVFVLGLVTRRVDQRGVLAGLAAGFGLDLWLWLARPDVSWLWWNVTGFAATVAVALVVSAVPRSRGRAPSAPPPFARDGLGRPWWPSYAVLALWAGVIALVALAFGRP